MRKVDEDLCGRLAVAVDAAVALLQAVRVPRDLGVGEQVALALQREALRRASVASSTRTG